MQKLRIAIAQFNPTVGDYGGNLKRMIAWTKKAARNKADLIVFPELSLCGYPVWDLANKKRFIAEGMNCLGRYAKAVSALPISSILGFIDHPELSQELGLPFSQGRKTVSPGGFSKSYNALAWIEKGRIRSIQHKRLLPTYDVFLEDIFFQPGETSTLIAWKKNLNVAPTICEDIWDDQYQEKPLEDPALADRDLIINISASPYFRGIPEIRDSLIKRHAARYRVPVLYVNQVGAQDDLIFDGRSLFVNQEGRILFKAPAFREDLFFVDWDTRGKTAAAAEDAGVCETAEVYEALCLGIRDYFRKNGFRKAVIGLSGGIDSALTAALAVDALGPEAISGVTMPGTYSSKGSWADSEDLAKRLGIDFRVRPIKSKYEFVVKEINRNKKKEGRKAPRRGEVTMAMENLQARLRGLELMFISNDEGRLVLTTGNKSELAVGYCTLYGDMAGGLAVLGDVYKTDVYRLARYRNRKEEIIPRTILDKAPSAELRPNQKDQDSLPPYEVLDEILYLYIEKNSSRGEIIERLGARGVDREIVKQVIHKVDHNEYKRRQTPPILRVTEKAWFGRRMPITNRFDR